jgi:hypothetical protein
MEKRHSERLLCHLKAKIISAGKTFDGFIENVSEEGLEYLISSLIQVPEDFTPEKMIKLIFQNHSGETINLTCEAKWFLRSSPDSKTLTVGMKIINPPQEYRELIRNENINISDDDAG